MRDVDAAGADRTTVAVLTQYGMATTEQLHLLLTPGERIGQTRRRLAQLRAKGVVDRITVGRAGRGRVWFPTPYGARMAGQWPELLGRRPSRRVWDRSTVRHRAGHALTMNEVALAFVQNARRRGERCRPLDWIPYPDLHHLTVDGQAVVPDALLHYRTGSGWRGPVFRAFVDVDRATAESGRLGARLAAYARLYGRAGALSSVPRQPAQPRTPREGGRPHCPPVPRLLFVLDGTAAAGVEERISALHAAAAEPATAGFLRDVPVLAATLTDVLRDGPDAPVWRPVQAPERRVPWTTGATRQG